MLEKINRIFEQDNELDSILIMANDDFLDPNFYYFSGLNKTKQVKGFIILRKNKKPVCLANALEYGSIVRNKDIIVMAFNNKNHALELIKKYGGKNAGIDFSSVSLKMFKWLKTARLKYTDVSDMIRELRSVKTKEEIKKISQACKITEEAMNYVYDLARNNISERQLAFELEQKIRKSGEGVAFPTIVAFAENSAIPHHITGSRRLRIGDMVLIDAGAVYDGYCSDITRMFVFGKPNEEQTYLYDAVYKIQRACIRKIKDGVKFTDVNKISNDMIKEISGKPMIHSIGHGIGIQVHESPFIDSVLKQNMCIAIEPGYYNDAKFGIRIEDELIVKAKGCKMLTNASAHIIGI